MSSHAQVKSLDRAQTEQEKLKQLADSKPDAYKDKFMDLSVLQALPSQDEAKPLGNGFSRYLVESRYGFSDDETTGADSRRSSDMGLRTEYHFDTLNYGEFAIEADVRKRAGLTDPNIAFLSAADKQQSGRITLRNRAFPVTTRFFADTSLGDVSSQVTDGLTRNNSFALGTSTVRGISTRVYSEDTDIRAGAGARGELVGGPYAGFEPTQGQLYWLGATQKLGRSLYGSLQINQANQVRDETGLSLGTASSKNISMMAASLGYGAELLNGGDQKAKLTLLTSRASNTADAASAKTGQGMFLEGGFKTGRYRHEMGLFQTLPNLYFGDYQASNQRRQGAFWRVDQHGSRFHWGGGLDIERLTPEANSAQASNQRLGLHANFQHVLGRDKTWGAYLHFSQTKSRDEARNDSLNCYNNSSCSGSNNEVYGNNSYYANAFYSTRFEDLGRSRFGIALRRNQSLVTNGVAATGEELTWEHDWVTGRYETMRPEFVTTLGMARDRSQGDQAETQLYPTAGVSFKYWPNSDLRMGGNISYSARNGDLSTSQGLAASLNMDKSFVNGWHFGVTASVNQATVKSDSAFLGNATTTALATRSQNKSVYMYLRYEGNSGRPYEVLGLRSAYSAGSGNVTGVVFFDTNSDKLPQLDEKGVPNVEVYLDGRYHTSTDQQGRFEYPSVATGKHRLSLKLESVPLPWGLGLDKGEVEVDVPLRGQVNVSMPIVKLVD